ncbi:hypothetical protein VNN41_05645 [Lactococcus garvieae]|uniref:hypothetical protein n=1 Tax=Lactococcus garvieae TaxID=1363 RepID=UPI003247B20B
MNLIEGQNEKLGHYVIDGDTGEVYAQDELPELMAQLFTESFGHEPEYLDETHRKLAEDLNKALRSKDFDKSPWGELFGLSDNQD